MATARAAQKPLLGQKMLRAGLRLKNQPLSTRTRKEKCRHRLRPASGAPVFANGAVTSAMAFAFNQLQSDGSGSMSKSEAIAEADKLNRSGSRIQYTAVETDRGWTVQPAEVAALERGVSSRMAKSVFNASSPEACATFCSAASTALSLTLGDVSGRPPSDSLNASMDVASHADDAIGILQKHTNESVRALATGLSRAPTIVKVGLLAPAAVNNFRACNVECQSTFFERKSQ